MRFFDAHCHLQDPRLRPYLESIADCVQGLGIVELVVNGTRPEDWPEVEALANRFAFVRPSFGLHPWFVAEASEGWQAELERLWNLYPKSGVGEIGLDRWVEGYDIESQKEAFLWQLRWAAERNRSVSIHCLQAWGMMRDILQEERLPERGFLLHSYGGPKEMVGSFAALGARFSLSGYFAHERKAKQREAWKAVPLDRLLIETDAPDMKGPERFEMEKISTDEGEELNHPANLVGVYRFAAELRGEEFASVVAEVERNYRSFFDL